MFDIIDIENLFKIIEVTDNFINIKDIQNMITVNEVNENGS